MPFLIFHAKTRRFPCPLRHSTRSPPPLSHCPIPAQNKAFRTPITVCSLSFSSDLSPECLTSPKSDVGQKNIGSPSANHSSSKRRFRPSKPPFFVPSPKPPSPIFKMPSPNFSISFLPKNTTPSLPLSMEKF